MLSLQEITIFFRKVTEDISMARITDVFQKMDQNGDETLDFNEFKVCIINHISIKSVFPVNRICSTKLRRLVGREKTP